MWSFNRIKDISKINTKEIRWKGPFSWPGYETENTIDTLPDLEGIYLWTFEYKDGYVVYAAGVTNSTKKRFRSHSIEYKRGKYTVLNIAFARQGERQEIWHGWNYARTHQEEYNRRKEEISTAVDTQLRSFRIFVALVNEKRVRERLEAAIMHHIYYCKEPWADLADRGMFLNGRYNSEVPIKIINFSNFKIYGLPDALKI